MNVLSQEILKRKYGLKEKIKVIYKARIQDRELNSIYDGTCVEVLDGIYFFDLKIPPLKRNEKYLFFFGDEDVVLFQVPKKKSPPKGGGDYIPSHKRKILQVIKLSQQDIINSIE